MNKKLYTAACILITVSLSLLNIAYGANAVVNVATDTAAQTKASYTGAIISGTAAAAAVAAGISIAISHAKDDNHLSANSSSSVDDALDRKLQQLLDQARTKNNIVNMSMSVSLSANSPTRNYVSGTLELNGTKKVTPDTLFQIGSITKSFTDSTILQLEAEGKLNIHDTLGKYLPNEYPEWNKVTLIQLMNMTSGIYDYIDEQFVMNEIFDPTYRYKTWQLHELADNTYSTHGDLLFPPGTKWYYSNTAYVLLGMIIQQITGHSVEYEFESRLLGENSQLELSNIYYLPYSSNTYPVDIKSRVANTYLLYSPGYKNLRLGINYSKYLKLQYKNQDNDANKILDITDIDMSWANTAGAIIAAPKDLINWVRDLFGSKVIPEEQFEEMTIKHWFPVDTSEIPFPPNTHYGLGLLATKDFAINKDNTIKGLTWWYQGGTLGGTAIFILLPDGAVITVASGVPLNSDSDFFLFLNNSFVEQVVFTVENYKKTHPVI